MPSWSPPTRIVQRRALGNALSPGLESWLDPKTFPPIPEPSDDDWPRGGRGQTFDAFVQSSGVRVPAPNRRSRLFSRRVIYLQPIGDELALFPDVSVLAAGCEAFFGVSTTVLPIISLRRLEADGRRAIGRRRNGQVNAADVNECLRIRRPADGITLCGVTMLDLYKGDFNYLFGLAKLGGAGVGVFSFHRQDPASPECEFHHGETRRQPGDEAVLLRRALMTLTHEIGHTFNLKHCVYFSCLMQGANSLEEAESRYVDLCPVCLRKLLWATRAESAEGARARYERLASFYAKHPQSFDERHALIASRIAPPLPPGEQCQPCAVGGT